MESESAAARPQVQRPSPSALPALWEPLQACAAPTRERLVAAAQGVTLAAGDLLVEAGGAPERVVVLSEGVLRVFHVGAESQFTVKLLRAPNAVGLVEVLTGNPYAGSVEALVPTAGIVVPARAVREEVERDDAFARAVLRDIAAKFEGTIRSTRHLGFDDAETRLVRVLLEYAEHFGRPATGGGGLVVRHALSLERLSREVGVTRRSIDRAVADLTRAGLVERSDKGWLVLKDPAALRSRLDR
ncbi:MAG TPA: Crp/Fnr family transcriptional regulator [Myxococcales bacterium]|jgi:CRP/FNR family transcriptional regulator